MRLIKARVQNYRSVIDSGLFDIDKLKTILVGPNEAGKSAILQALQKLNPPEGTAKFDSLRDYPRSKYNEITTGVIKVEDVLVVEGHFQLDTGEIEDIPETFKNCTYVFKKHLNNSTYHELLGSPPHPKYSEISNDIKRLISHIEQRILLSPTAIAQTVLDAFKLEISEWRENQQISIRQYDSFIPKFEALYPLIEEGKEIEEARFPKIRQILSVISDKKIALEVCRKSMPVIILFSNIFRVKPLIHLDHLATRIEKGLLDDVNYDYGNLCLLKLLGFDARELSILGKTPDPVQNNQDSIQAYRDQLDKRSYQLNAASVKLTQEIRKVWNPNPDRVEANKLRVCADGQYLKVVVEDDLGVEIELDQRSEGFQWLVSFFVVFFAEADDKHSNAILLLDEPGLSLHGLKQKEFRLTITRLAEKNQTIFTTHSPFLVGSDELEIVRVVEMINRIEGTKVHTTVSAGDSSAMLPLQEALGYDLAQSLFFHQKNLILEGLTDYWYLQSLSDLFRSESLKSLDENISMLPASSASKVVYFATILHSNKLKVAALLDSDSSGDAAAQQDTLVNALGNRRIIRTKDVYVGAVPRTEIEDLIRDTLVKIAKSNLNWDIESIALSQPNRPIVDIFGSECTGFSKYKLAKEFIKWTNSHSSSDLSGNEAKHFELLFDKINKALK